MFVAGFPSLMTATNCWVIAPGPGEQCVVIDPGIGIGDELDDIIASNRLHPVAVLLSHGHYDHTFSVLPVCQARGIPAYIHPDDRAQLSDPWGGIGMAKGSPLFGLDNLTFAEPDDVQDLTDGQLIELAGLPLRIAHAPGHTQGSIMFELPVSDDRPQPLLFSGDVLFAGSIGRVDLPGGSMAAMQTSLRNAVLPLADATIVHPGHGPSTTIGTERASNPFLRQLA